MSSLLRALFNGTSRHKKLSENWATTREPVVEGVTFYCKYLGSTMVDDPKGESTTAEAIKRIIQIAKMTVLKPEKVSLHVSVEGIRVHYTETSATLIHTSIYKISYCSADAHYDHVFAFIATNDNDTCECHAFLCPKRKMAQAVTVSIAQAFNLAYEYWKMAMENKDSGEIFAHEELPAEVMVNRTVLSNQPKSQPSSQTSSPIPIRSDFGSSDMSSTSGYQSSTQALLIDFDDSSEKMTDQSKSSESNSKDVTKPWDVFDDFGEISDEFSRLGVRAVGQPHHSPGTSPPEWVDLDHAASMVPPPVSRTENTSWLSANSPPPLASPTASSQTNPWSVGQSPPDSWETFSSRSPNMAFLHSCQSPPSGTAFSNINRNLSAQRSKTNAFFSKPLNDPFAVKNTNSFPIKNTNMSNVNTLSSQTSIQFSKTAPANTCGTRQQAWSGNFYESGKNKLICS